MTDQQWARIDDAARDVRVLPGTIRVWVHRGKVESQRVGARTLVHLGDVRRAERDWRARVRDVHAEYV